MVATIQSTDPENDRCPACGDKLIGVPTLRRHARTVMRFRAALEKIADPLTLEMPGYIGTELAMRLIQKLATIAKDALNDEQSGDSK